MMNLLVPRYIYAFIQEIVTKFQISIALVQAKESTFLDDADGIREGKGFRGFSLS
jgi:hypothetical protein